MELPPELEVPVSLPIELLPELELPVSPIEELERPDLDELELLGLELLEEPTELPVSPDELPELLDPMLGPELELPG